MKQSAYLIQQRETSSAYTHFVEYWKEGKEGKA